MIHVPPNTTLTALYQSQTMPIIAQRPGQVEVRLPGRPNGSTEWLSITRVKIGDDPYAIFINLTTKHLRLDRLGRSIGYFPVGIGAKTTPTPTGNFYVRQFDSPPNPGYGPWVIITSAHSTAIRSWDGTGDAEIGIHGPLGANIGNGVAVSHGCVRMMVADQVQLRDVPLGTPIEILK